MDKAYLEPTEVLESNKLFCANVSNVVSSQKIKEILFGKEEHKPKKMEDDEEEDGDKDDTNALDDTNTLDDTIIGSFEIEKKDFTKSICYAFPKKSDTPIKLLCNKPYIFVENSVSDERHIIYTTGMYDASFILL